MSTVSLLGRNGLVMVNGCGAEDDPIRRPLVQAPVSMFRFFVAKTKCLPPPFKGKKVASSVYDTEKCDQLNQLPPPLCK